MSGVGSNTASDGKSLGEGSPVSRTNLHALGGCCWAGRADDTDADALPEDGEAGGKAAPTSDMCGLKTM